MKIIIKCYLCNQRALAYQDIPEDWKEFNNLIIVYGLCPDHYDIKPFVDSQCEDCTDTWGACAMWQWYLEKNNKKRIDSQILQDKDLEDIENGFCPFRRTTGAGLTYTKTPAPKQASVALYEHIFKKLTK